MTELRDTRRPIEFWNEMLALQHEYFHSKDRFAMYNERVQSGEDLESAIGSLSGLYTEAYLEDITYSYCRGDDLDGIKEKYIDGGIDRFILTCDEFDKHKDKLEPYSRCWNPGLQQPHNVHSAYSMICWFVCFEADPEKLGRIAPYIGVPGIDRLVDTVLQKYDPDREVASEDQCRRTFKLLQSVMDVDEATAIENLQKYLASWGKQMGTLKGLKSVGVTGTEGAKSNESLIANLDTIKNISYRGFWAWEVALVVRHFGIDDSSFRDHEFYPKDLADYRPGSKQPAITSGVQNKENSTLTLSDRELKKQPEIMLDELFVALDLDADATNPVLMPDVFSTGHSHGEYLFYAAADKLHGIDELSPNKINENTMKASFYVEVSFQADTHGVASHEIEQAKTFLARGESYESVRERVEMDGPASFLEAFDQEIVFLPIEAGENWASWVLADGIGSGDPSLRVRHQAVEGERTLTIQAYLTSDDFTLADMLEHWQTLVDKYRHIPMRVFTGSPVE